MKEWCDFNESHPIPLTINHSLLTTSTIKTPIECFSMAWQIDILLKGIEKKYG
jgi:hypothetical protein